MSALSLRLLPLNSLPNSRNPARSPHSEMKHGATDLCSRCICSQGKQRRGMLEPGLWVLFEARGGVSFQVPRLGPCLPLNIGCRSLCQGRMGASRSKCCCCPIPQHPAELRQGQGRSNTPPNSRSSLPQGSWKHPQTWLPVRSPSLSAVSLVIYEMQMMMAIMRMIIPALAASRLS